MSCFAQRSGKRRPNHRAFRCPDGRIVCIRCDVLLDERGEEVLLSAEELSLLGLAASTAAEHVKSYTLPGGTTTYDEKRIGRMLAAEPWIASLLPRLLSEVAARRRSQPGRRGRR